MFKLGSLLRSRRVVWLGIALQLAPFLLYLYSVELKFATRSPDQNSPASPAAMTIRASTAADLDAITDLGLASLHDDPVWPYRFPGAKAYPEDHYRFSRIRFSEYLDGVAGGAYQSMVIEVPDEKNPAVAKIIAFSMWSLPESWRPPKGSRPGIKPPSDHPERRDASPARMLEFRKQLALAKKAWFDPRYGDEQLNLMILATHPDYRRRGAASKLLQWGIAEAAASRKGVTLFASPMGLPLYRKNGFRQVGLVHVQVKGEEKYVELPAMVLEPSLQ